MLAHFYHVYADGAWQAPLAEHLAALDASGLGAALDYRAAGVVGQPANCQAAISALGPGWQIAAVAGTGHEEVTIRKLHEFAALDGKAFYRALAQAKPALIQHVIFVTGDVAGTDAEQFLQESGCRWLAKPFRLADLLKAVREGLS